jgi:hypothetical protein
LTASGTVKINDAVIKTATIDKATLTNCSISAGQINSGTLTSDRIPNLNASKITAGKIDVDRIDVDAIFAQDITAKGTISGATLSGGSLTVSNLTIKDGEKTKVGSTSYTTPIKISGSDTIAVYGDPGGNSGNGWHIGLTAHMEFMMDTLDQGWLYICKGLVVGWGNNKAE